MVKEIQAKTVTTITLIMVMAAAVHVQLKVAMNAVEDLQVLLIHEI